MSVWLAPGLSDELHGLGIATTLDLLACFPVRGPRREDLDDPRTWADGQDVRNVGTVVAHGDREP